MVLRRGSRVQHTIGGAAKTKTHMQKPTIRLQEHVGPNSGAHEQNETTRRDFTQDIYYVMEETLDSAIFCKALMN